MKMKDTDKSLTAEDKSVTLVYCKGQTMYHNQQNTQDNTMKPGVGTTTKEISFDITVGSSTSTGKIGESLNWSFSAQSGKLTISGTFPTGAKLIAAVYTADGRLVGTRILTAEGETTLPDGAAIKLFLLNGMTNAPLCRFQVVVPVALVSCRAACVSVLPVRSSLCYRNYLYKIFELYCRKFKF